MARYTRLQILLRVLPQSLQSAQERPRLDRLE
jgi:hypothetical protein